MNKPPADSASTPRVSDLIGIFPPSAELRPFLDLLITSSRPDPGRRWAGSGELGTVGDRLVDSSALGDKATSLGAEEAARIAALFRRAASAAEAAARGAWEDAAEALLAQGGADESAGRTREAEAWYLAAHALARKHGSVQGPRALRLAARSARRNGDLEASANRYEDAWRDAVALGLESEGIVAAMGRGNVAVDRGFWSEARTWYEQALQAVGAAGPPRRERWQLFQNLAIVARRSGSLDEARSFLERAREEGDRLGDPDAVVEVENGWGQLLLAEGDPRRAELHFLAALDAAVTAVARVTIAVNLGEALLAQGRSLEAGERAREAEAYALAGAVTAKLPEVYRLLAAVARQRGEGEAFVILNRALDLIREKGLPRYEEAQTREALGALRVQEGDVARGLAELTAAARAYEAIGMEAAVARLHDVIQGHGGEPPSPGENGGAS